MIIPTLLTERLILRPFSLNDAHDVQRLAGEAVIAATTLNIPHPYEDGMAETWISTHQTAFETGQSIIWAVVQKADGMLVGSISLMGLTARHQAELGYWIGHPFWNQGFCTEAGIAVLHHAFLELNLIRVHSCHLTRNPASGCVMRKLGMTHEGSRKQHVIKDGQFEDLELYGILRPGCDAMRSKLYPSLNQGNFIAQ